MPVTRRTLRRFALFKGLDEAALSSLLPDIRQLRLPANTTIFKDNEVADCLYLVQSGAVDIIKATAHGPLLLNTIRPPDLFGEMGLLDDQPRSAAARTAMATTLLQVPRQVFLPLVERYPRILHSASSVGTERLRQRDKTLIAELMAHNKQLQNLYQTSLDISRHLELSQALAAIAQRAATLLNASQGQLHLYDAASGHLIPQLGPSGAARRSGRVKSGAGTIGRAFATGEAIFKKGLPGERSGRVLAAPVSLDSKPAGVLSVYRRARDLAFTPADAQLLILFANQAAIAIENARLYGLAVDKGRMDGELKAARRVQQSLIPAHPPRIPGFHLAGFWRPAREVAGDYYDFIPLPGGRWGIVVADVSDKGMPAALLMTETRSILRASGGAEPTPSRAMERANRLLCLDATGGMFVTLIFAVLEPGARAVTFANAGHNPPLLWHDATRQLEELRLHSLPLGIEPEIRFIDNHVTLEPGDVFVLNTDGVTDALNEQGESFGQDRLLGLVQATASGGNARAVVHALDRAMADFIGREPPLDDVTVVALGARGK